MRLPLTRKILTWAVAVDLLRVFQVVGAGTSDDFFETRIRPVLAEHCWECHSATAKKVRGGLRLDSREALLQGGETGPAIRPGDPGKSLALAAMEHRDPDLAMPPKKPRLPDPILSDLRQWIADGAPWPVSPKAGDTTDTNGKPAFDLQARKTKQSWLWHSPTLHPLPKIAGKAWPRTELDTFVLAGLESAGLKPARDADPRTWLRRVHFTLTGLPPSIEEQDRFLADTSSRGRERVVDGLLASPHFGERWARHWMDLMRYAESRGHESDYPIANAWQYRDYLIRAFNQGVPYNQFLMEHLAGDLLPKPRLNPVSRANESVLGTGWAFLGEEVHSPVDIRQDECERVDNKVDVFTKSFLGLTVGCARCHDHKFDPIRSRDYYALCGFVLSSGFRQARFETMEIEKQIGSELNTLRERERPHFAKALSRRLQSAAKEPGFLNRLEAALLHNRNASRLERQTLKASTAVRVLMDYTDPTTTWWRTDGEGFGRAPVKPGELQLDGPIRLATHGAATRDPFWNRLKNAPDNQDDSGALAATSRSGRMLRTPTFTLTNGMLHYLIRGKARVYAAVDSHLMIEGPLHGRLMQTFEVNAEEPAWVHHDLTPYAGHRAHVEFGPVGDAPLELLKVVEAPAPPGNPVPPLQELFGDSSAANPPSSSQLRLTWNRAIDALEQNRITALPNAAGHAALINLALQDPQISATSNKLNSVRERYLASRDRLATRLPWVSHTAVTWLDGSGVDENILIRGKPGRPGPVAVRSLPEVFSGSKPINSVNTSGRLELGNQLADPDNPLVARVFVNRVWHHVFGRGLVATVDNFGALGEAPSHPELLDHMARGFVTADQWSLKRLVKKLVLSRTYAMSSAASDPQAEQADPDNRLLHRMPLHRLEAESIRDTLLAVSGTLDRKLLGPPVPVHLNEFVVGRGRPEASGPLDGAGRRSLYVAVRRNFLQPTLLTFDTPTPFSTVGRRNVTNVPAQCLVLMNDELVHQEAKRWAARSLKAQPNLSPELRIHRLFCEAYGRPPTPGEVAACLDTRTELESLRTGSRAAQDSWGDLCHALLNANEFIYVN